MDYLNKRTNTRDIKAETLISQLDIKKDFNVRLEGVFARNYSEDLIDIEKEDDTKTIALSRDGIFHLLPEGLFFKENQLKKYNDGFDFKKEYDQFKKQKKDVLSFFQPFDTAFFKLSLELEQKLNDFTKSGNRIFINTFLDTSEVKADNQYISKIKTLLPFVSKIRGNISYLIDILKNALSVEKIEIKEMQAFHTRFIIHKEGLSKEEYLAMDKDLDDFFVFFRHWFLPVEKEYDYRIKDYKQPFKLGDSLILDYNTNL